MNFHTEPNNKYGMEIINPFTCDNFDRTFSKQESGCWTNDDPRLISGARGTRLELNRPPLLGLNNHDPKSCKYKSYDEIKIGQVMYYQRDDFRNVYFNPLFSDQAIVKKNMYRDPMGNIKPSFIRESTLHSHDNNRLTWLRDTQWQRNDIISKQMWERNQSRYGI